jgi:peptidoglycan/LPS O-acetylase OafA/YrhL
VRSTHVHYPYLDGLRGLAILLVLAGHALGFSLGITAAAPLGGTGVMVFFVLSGFLITNILHAERVRTSTVSLRRFYLRRTLRIFPAYYAMVGVVALLAAAGLVTTVDTRNVVICLLYLRNIGGTSEVLVHAWSLALEEQFYVLWPSMFLLLPRSAGRAAAVTAVLILILTIGRTVGMIGHFWPTDAGVFNQRPWFRFDSLWIGCALALWTAHGVRPGLQRSLIRIPTSAWLLALVGWSVAARIAALVPLHQTVEMVLAGGLLLRLHLAPDGWVGLLMQSQVMRWFGKLSYSLYLWQQLFLVVHTPDWGILRVFPVNLLCVAAAALASYTFVERPFLRLKAKLGG